MSGLFGKPKRNRSSQAEAQPPAEPRPDPRKAAAEERKRRMKQSGRASTILIGGQGDVSTARTASKMLLGI